jgi:hypothetical protein
MTVTDVAAVPLSEVDHRAQLRRAVIASTVGTTIEGYDFLLYGQMAALVFAKLYFPSSDPLTGTLQAFAVFAVGFVARPIGAAIFGHYGDRIGRKAALIATLLLTGLSTFFVGCVPTGRLLSGQPRDPGVQPDVGRTVLRLGMARPVLAEPRHGGYRAVDPARHPRDVPRSSRTSAWRAPRSSKC